MALPINIDDLISSDTVESVRLEFKEGWNPEEVLHTSCAFLNDIKGDGGGYIIIGIREKDGIPELPPLGINQNQIDGIQKEFSEKIVFLIKPTPSLSIEPILYNGKWIIVIWITTGEERPYSAPSSLGMKGQRKEYIREGAITRAATEREKGSLLELSRFKPFDDRINTTATIKDLDLTIILAYLQRIKSQLFDEAPHLPIEVLCTKMQIARGPRENIRPLNVGLLMFSSNPEKYFEGCRTILVEIGDEEVFIEKDFIGPIHIQAESILRYLKDQIIKESVVKSDSGVETYRFWNFPFQALKESIVNALYHRDYNHPTPNEIRIYKSGPNRRIEILSYPGPMPPIDQEALLQEQFSSRNYRNIRIGDWLKRLRLAEKLATGVASIKRAMLKNGSPPPEFRTDEDKTIFAVTLKIHPDWPEDYSLIIPETIVLTNLEQTLLEHCNNQVYTIAELIKLSYPSFPKEKVNTTIDDLTKKGYLQEKVIKKIFSLFSIKVFTTTEKGRNALKRAF